MVEQYKIAVISNAHLAPAEAKELETTPAGDLPFIMAPFEEGWFVSCHSARSQETEAHVGPYAEGRYPCLRAIRLWAAANEYEYVMLDRDAECVPELMEYDWDTLEDAQ